MSLTTSEMTPADIRACTCGNDGYGNDGMFGGNGAWWIIILLLFGWGRNGFGGFGGNGGGAVEGYTLATDFANIERKLDGINNGICDSTFALNNTINGNFRTLDGAICNLGYQALQNTNAIQTKLSDCCCNIEKMDMQTRFDNQAYNCNTLQAIDKLGDRIIDHLNAEKNQALRDENFALRLSASQSAQNQYIVNTLRPMPVPAYASCNPWAASYGWGCNSGCGC